MPSGDLKPIHDFEEFFIHSLDMLCIAGTDGYFKRVNPSFERILGWTEEELLSRPFADFIHPEDVAATAAEVASLARGVPTISFENRYRTAKGEYRHLLWTGFPQAETGLLFAVARDTTELLQANQRFRVALDSSPAAVVMVDSAGRIRLVNLEAERLFGYARAELLGSSIEMLIPPDSHAEHRGQRAAFFENPQQRPMGQGRYLTAMRKDGSEFPAEIGLTPIELSDGIHVLSSVVDLSLQRELEQRLLESSQELEVANAELARLAATDQLTGLLNRRALDERLANHVDLMRRMEDSLSLLLIDLDHFKQLNDRHGHVAGDRALRLVASLLRQNSRTTDIVARYGGEEFAVILPATDAAGASRLANKLRAAVEAEAQGPPALTVSIGAASLTFADLDHKPRGDETVMLLDQADQALYASKGSGRNRVTHFSELDGD